MSISLITLLAVFLVIAVRQIGHVRFQIWQVMSLGATVVLLTGQIGFEDSLEAINVDVMFFLFGMFVVGQALDESGYLAHLSYKYFERAKSRDTLLLMIIFGAIPLKILNVAVYWVFLKLAGLIISQLTISNCQFDRFSSKEGMGKPEIRDSQLPVFHPPFSILNYQFVSPLCLSFSAC